MNTATTTTPRNKLRSFQDVVKRSKLHKLMRETQDYTALQTDITSDLNYLVMSLAKNLSFDEKVKRIGILATKVTDVEESDVIVMAMWVPSEGE